MNLQFDSIDDQARATYSANFGGAELAGDVTELRAVDLPDHDVLTAGFPCQPFTKAGAQPGLSTDEGQLYLELVRILIAKRPPSFLFENVANLVAHGAEDVDATGADGCGVTCSTILAAFEACGYTVPCSLLHRSVTIERSSISFSRFIFHH